MDAPIEAIIDQESGNPQNEDVDESARKYIDLESVQNGNIAKSPIVGMGDKSSTNNSERLYLISGEGAIQPSHAGRRPSFVERTRSLGNSNPTNSPSTSTEGVTGTEVSPLRSQGSAFFESISTSHPEPNIKSSISMNHSSDSLLRELSAVANLVNGPDIPIISSDPDRNVATVRSEPLTKDACAEISHLELSSLDTIAKGDEGLCVTTTSSSKRRRQRSHSAASETQQQLPTLSLKHSCSEAEQKNQPRLSEDLHLPNIASRLSKSAHKNEAKSRQAELRPNNNTFSTEDERSEYTETLDISEPPSKSPAPKPELSTPRRRKREPALPGHRHNSKPLYLRMIARGRKRLQEEEKSKLEEYARRRQQRAQANLSKEQLKEHMVRHDNLVRDKLQERRRQQAEAALEQARLAKRRQAALAAAAAAHSSVAKPAPSSDGIVIPAADCSPDLIAAGSADRAKARERAKCRDRVGGNGTGVGERRSPRKPRASRDKGPLPLSVVEPHPRSAARRTPTKSQTKTAVKIQVFDPSTIHADAYEYENDRGKESHSARKVSSTPAGGDMERTDGHHNPQRERSNSPKRGRSNSSNKANIATEIETTDAEISLSHIDQVDQNLRLSPEGRVNDAGKEGECQEAYRIRDDDVNSALHRITVAVAVPVEPEEPEAPMPTDDVHLHCSSAWIRRMKSGSLLVCLASASESAAPAEVSPLSKWDPESVYLQPLACMIDYVSTYNNL